MQMSESFAATIAAVIPVIWLVGALEVHQQMKVYLASAQHLEASARQGEKLQEEAGTNPTPAQLLTLHKKLGEHLDDGVEQLKTFPPTFLIPLWAVVVAALLLAELEALRWLVTDDPGPRPGWALFMLVTTMVGFGAVTVIPVVVAMMQTMGHLRRGKQRHAALHEASARQLRNLNGRVGELQEQAQVLEPEGSALRPDRNE
ncbi:hypothetical protein AB0O08_11810 [Streptomyces anulatus]|uniref:hypothetical protein n=1 Tax=Streptomyces anulatus TaxID=1892 RepID=UPI00341D7D68